MSASGPLVSLTFPFVGGKKLTNLPCDIFVLPGSMVKVILTF